MHLILMPENPGRSISIRFDYRHVLVLLFILLGLLVWSGYLGFHFSHGQPVAEKAKPALAQNPQLDQLAIRVGELQARLAQITDTGDRMAKKVGIPLPKIPANNPGGQGGPYIPESAQKLSAMDLANMLDDLSRRFDRESDRLTVLDSDLMNREASRAYFPMSRPVGVGGWISSPFGIRLDPFTGKMARHEGLDFADKLGAPILAAASGVVISVRVSPDYGNVIDIDHGHGLTTRYGHCLHILVKKGDVVKRGQEIALVGSTGRSTGPHCHFEVRRYGVPQNPIRYLARRL